MINGEETIKRIGSCPNELGVIFASSSHDQSAARHRVEPVQCGESQQSIELLWSQGLGQHYVGTRSQKGRHIIIQGVARQADYEIAKLYDAS